MRKAFTVTVLILSCLDLFSQEENPVHWQCKAIRVNDKVYELHFIAYIDIPWHIYSQSTSGDFAQPTVIHLNHTPLVEIKGKTTEKGDLHTISTAGANISYFDGQVEFVQLVRLKASVKTNVTGVIQYMACTDGRCLPPFEHHFALALLNR